MSIESEPHSQPKFVCFADRMTGEQTVEEEVQTEKPKSQGDELVEVKLAGKNEEPRPIFLSTCLSNDLRSKILELVQEFRDVFAWTYGEMPDLDSRLVTHKLNIKEGTKPIKQAPRNFRLELEIQIKEEI